MSVRTRASRRVPCRSLCESVRMADFGLKLYPPTSFLTLPSYFSSHSSVCRSHLHNFIRQPRAVVWVRGKTAVEYVNRWKSWNCLIGSALPPACPSWEYRVPDPSSSGQYSTEQIKPSGYWKWSSVILASFNFSLDRSLQRLWRGGKTTVQQL